MRASSPGGRFTTDFELDAIGDGITWDATNPVGTHAEFWTYDIQASTVDDIYDVEPIGAGRIWLGPQILHVVRAEWTQGIVNNNQRGFYSADTLRFTVNIDDLKDIAPELFNARGMAKAKISDVDRYRIVWKEQVYRPTETQTEGYVDDRGTMIILKMLQVMPDELVNDVQFLNYAQP
jgi:hypothetical protein